MEISPIAGIRTLPVVKAPPADSGLSPVFDIENSSKPGDDSYTGSNKKAAGGEDEDDSDEGIDPESAGQAVSASQISFFA